MNKAEKKAGRRKSEILLGSMLLLILQGCKLFQKPEPQIFRIDATPAVLRQVTVTEQGVLTPEQGARLAIVGWDVRTGEARLLPMEGPTTITCACEGSGSCEPFYVPDKAIYGCQTTTCTACRMTAQITVGQPNDTQQIRLKDISLVDLVAGISIPSSMEEMAVLPVSEVIASTLAFRQALYQFLLDTFYGPLFADSAFLPEFFVKWAPPELVEHIVVNVWGRWVIVPVLKPLGAKHSYIIFNPRKGECVCSCAGEGTGCTTCKRHWTGVRYCTPPGCTVCRMTNAIVVPPYQMLKPGMEIRFQQLTAQSGMFEVQLHTDTPTQGKLRVYFVEAWGVKPVFAELKRYDNVTLPDTITARFQLPEGMACDDNDNDWFLFWYEDTDRRILDVEIKSPCV